MNKINNIEIVNNTNRKSPLTSNNQPTKIVNRFGKLERFR